MIEVTSHSDDHHGEDHPALALAADHHART